MDRSAPPAKAAPPQDGEAAFEALRPLLLRIAYRMLGAMSDAEDVVQEAWLRWQRALDGGEVVEEPRAYLRRAVTRLCIDRLRSLAAERRRYDGAWLPEPVLGEEPHAQLAVAESLRIGFLLLLERLSPVERAVFLLREVFDCDYDEIAITVEKSEVNCRQIFARARAHMNAGRPRFPLIPGEEERVAGAFFAALGARDLEGLKAVLGAAAVAETDSGGQVRAARNTIHGADRVARFLLGLGRKAQSDVVVQPARINGQPGLVAFQAGRLFLSLALDVAEGQVQAVRMTVNPDKLRHLAAQPAG